MDKAMTPTLDALVRAFRERVESVRARTWHGPIATPDEMATLLDALTAAQEQGYTRVGHDDVSLLEDGCGLSIDMLDADRLRVWADKLAEHGPNVSHFASVTWMQGELARLSQAIAAQVRDVGRLRAALARRIAEGEWRPIETAPKDGTVVVGALFYLGRLCRVSDMKHNGLAFYTINGGSLPQMTHWAPAPATRVAEETPR